MGQEARDPILSLPYSPPEHPQAGVVGPAAVVEALVTFLRQRFDHTAEGSPTGMVVDLGLRARRPKEDLQGAGALATKIVSHTPILGPFCLLHEGLDVRIQKGWLPGQTGEYGDGLLQGRIRGKLRKLVRLAHIRCDRHQPSRLSLRHFFLYRSKTLEETHL
jgi:hypothetical protein